MPCARKHMIDTVLGARTLSRLTLAATLLGSYCSSVLQKRLLRLREIKLNVSTMLWDWDFPRIW